MKSQVINPIKRTEKVFVMMDHFYKLAVLPETNIVCSSQFSDLPGKHHLELF